MATNVVVGRTPQFSVSGSSKIGPRGEKGDKGDPGESIPKYTHDQTVPSDTWTVNHNLNTRPNTTVYSIGGKELLVELLHTSLNQVVVYFDTPTIGSVVCQ